MDNWKKKKRMFDYPRVDSPWQSPAEASDEVFFFLLINHLALADLPPEAGEEESSLVLREYGKE